MSKVYLAFSAAALALLPMTASVAAADDTPAAITGASAAAAVGGNFVVNGSAYTIPDQLLATGSGAKAYSVTSVRTSYAKTIPLPSGSVLTVKTGRVTDYAVSKGVVGTSETTTGSSTITSLNSNVSNPNIGTLATVLATKVSSIAQFTKSSTKASGTGSTTLDGVTITLSGDLTGGAAVTLTCPSKACPAKPAANFVLYKNASGTVTVYLNRQITNVSAIAKDTNVFVETSLEVEAVDVHLNDVKIFDGLITASGDVLAGVSYAN